MIYQAIDTGVSSALDNAGSSVLAQGVDTATKVLPYAATFLAIGVGWRMVRRFLGR